MSRTRRTAVLAAIAAVLGGAALGIRAIERGEVAAAAPPTAPAPARSAVPTTTAAAAAPHAPDPAAPRVEIDLAAHGVVDLVAPAEPTAGDLHFTLDRARLVDLAEHRAWIRWPALAGTTELVALDAPQPSPDATIVSGWVVHGDERVGQLLVIITGESVVARISSPRGGITYHTSGDRTTIVGQRVPPGARID